ncbi:hypothetical protein BH24ACT11_BH24ACT11_15890 [soil metagenome]
MGHPGGWRVIVVTAEQLFGDPVGVATTVAGALRARGLDDCQVRLSPLWRSLFQWRAVPSAVLRGASATGGAPQHTAVLWR